MTDQDHARYVTETARSLNNAIEDATRAGIRVIVRVDERHSVGFPPEPLVSVELSRPLKASA